MRHRRATNPACASGHPAASGAGRAVRLLQELEGPDMDPLSSPLTRFGEVMRDRGDMSAQLLLAENAASEEDKLRLYHQAISTQRCDYDDTMALAEFAIRHQREDAKRWLSIAEHIAGDDAWRKVKIADVYMAFNRSEWKAELVSQAEFFIDLYDHLPKELVFQRELLAARLA